MLVAQGTGSRGSALGGALSAPREEDLGDRNRDRDDRDRDRGRDRELDRDRDRVRLPAIRDARGTEVGTSARALTAR